LAQRFPKKINGFVYKDLLIESRQKNTAESQIVSCLDKRDALGESFLKQPEEKDVVTIVQSSKLHTRESLTKETDNFHYDLWKEILIKQGGEEEIQKLTEQREF
jgi:hypothetical protein